MIKYNLICDKDHEFESWFSDSLKFEKLKKKKLLECIFCSSKRIEKSIMSPMISNSNNSDFPNKFERELLKEKKRLKQIRKYKSLGYKLNDQMVLEEFEMRRKLDNSAYSFGTLSLEAILSSNNKFVNYVTRKGLGLVEKNSYFKQFFVRSATGQDFFKTF